MTSADLPDGWVDASLGDITEKRVPKVTPEGDGTFTYVDIASVDSTDKKIAHPKTILTAEAPSRARQHLRVDDVVVSMTRPNLNAVAKVTPDLDGAIASTGFDVLRAREVDPAWIFARVRSRQFVKEMTGLVQGALYPAVKSADVRSHHLPIPPLNEQRRILARIEALQERSRRVRSHLEAILPALDWYRQSVLAAAFRGDLTANWRVRNPEAEQGGALLTRIFAERRLRWEEAEVAKMSAKGRKPKNEKWKEKYKGPRERSTEGEIRWGVRAETWAFATLESLADAVRGIPYGIVQTGEAYTGGVPTVRGGDIKAFSVDVPNLKLVSPEVAGSYGRTELKGGEVLVAIRGTVGATAAAGPDMAGMNVSREVAMIPLLTDVHAEYVAFALGCPAAQWLMSGHVKGVAQQGINLADLRCLAVPVPPLEEQIAIVEMLSTAMRHIAKVAGAVRRATDDLHRLDQAVLVEAFRGRLVAQDPGDEPASILLEKAQTQVEGVRLALPPRRGSGREIVSKLTADSLRTIIADLPDDSFSFDSLRDRVRGDYDTLRTLVFELLGEEIPVIRQVFDVDRRAMRFERIES